MAMEGCKLCQSSLPFPLTPHFLTKKSNHKSILSWPWISTRSSLISTRRKSLMKWHGLGKKRLSKKKFGMKNAPFHIYRTERGGEVTYQGPGQLVMYPITNLRRHKMDLHWYLKTIEEVVIRVLSSCF